MFTWIYLVLNPVLLVMNDHLLYSAKTEPKIPPGSSMFNSIKQMLPISPSQYVYYYYISINTNPP